MSDSRDTVTQIKKRPWDRVLGLGSIFAVGYGDLGSSIYYALAITALYSLGATPISLLLAGSVFACTALSYAELSSMTKEAGGSALFTKKAFNDLVSFIAGWGLMLDFIVTIAISAFTVGPYISFFFESMAEPQNAIILSVSLIILLYGVNIFGVKHSTRISWVLTTLTLATQLLIVVVGLLSVFHFKSFISNLAINVPDNPFSPTWKEFWKGTAMAMVAYTGIESMAQLASEAKTPSKTVPKAMLLAMGVLLVMYMGISMVALSALSPIELSTKYLSNPILGIIEHLPWIGGHFLQGWIALLAGVILLVAANAGLMGASRLCFNMSENYQIPRFVQKLHPRFKTPYVSLGVFALFAIVIIIFSEGKITFLTDLYNFGAMLSFFATHASLILLRIRSPELARPFKVPFNIKIKGKEIPITAVLGGLASISVWVLVIITKPDGRYLGFSWMTLGLIMYFLYRRKQKIAPTGNVTIRKIDVPNFKTRAFKNILVPTRGGDQTATLQMACQLAKLFDAEITALHITEVPFSLPLNAPLYRSNKSAQYALEYAEAIGREFHLLVNLKSFHSRSVAQSVVDIAEQNQHDLIILGASMKKGSTHKMSSTVDKITKNAPCPVWILGDE
ncbi:amino acid permease [Candidatus Aerophobetes bacterium]|uniref:Amino acid permease n=1 Tax=Aerophobetes bacterium TaxID=2030807 RepID=A0A2A4X2P2_UNCAE|nr:MAG: amino acid permease [Candidatus Aerophobetes bacterium]